MRKLIISAMLVMAVAVMGMVPGKAVAGIENFGTPVFYFNLPNELNSWIEANHPEVFLYSKMEWDNDAWKKDGGTGDMPIEGDPQSITVGPFNPAIKLFAVKSGNAAYTDGEKSWMGVAYLLEPSQTEAFSYSIASGKDISFVAAYAVPIPGAAWLLGSGLLGLIALRRRQTK